MTLSGDSPRRTCYACRERINPNTYPWSEVSTTGAMRYWHQACDATRPRRDSSFGRR